MVNQGQGIIVPQFDLAVRQGAGRGRPWFMDQIIGQSGNFGNIVAHISAFGVEALALQDGVEYPEIGGGIGSRSRNPLPAGRIARAIGIKQRIPEPAFALSPIDHEMFDQKGGGDHAHTIMHEACLPEFAHSGIDNRIAGQPASPRFEVVRMIHPWKVIKPALIILVGKVWIVIKQVIGKFAPSQFRLERAEIFVRRLTSV